MTNETTPKQNTINKTIRFSFVGETGYFLIAGFFIPGFTAIILVGLQLLLTWLGVECILAFKIVFSFCVIGSMVLPYLFIRYLTKADFLKVNMSRSLFFFNILEYTFIQGGFALFLCDIHTLCYVTDGQNGIQLVFCGWLALPIIILLSLFFDLIRKRK